MTANLVLYVRRASLFPHVMIVKYQHSVILILALGLLLVLAWPAAAQSSDQTLPSPVRSEEIVGRIAPLDLGDPRLTRRFYAFEGTPGDLLVTLNSRNLNGDMDVFTAVTFRPLMKITFYATNTPQTITKSVFLHDRQVLILRVEARTPNDDDGSYQIRFGGAFAPFSGGIPVAENAESSNEESRSADRGANRLSSAGARIERPLTEPAPQPAEKAPETANASPPAKAARTTSTKGRTASRRRGTTTTRTSRPAAPKAAPRKSAAAKTKTSEEKKETAPTGSEKPPAVEKPVTQEPITPPAGAHLIIEEKDGTRIDRPMSTVRRVVIEAGTIVVVLKTGRSERIPMSAVVRMAIEP